MKKIITVVLAGVFISCQTDFDQINQDLAYLDQKIDVGYQQIRASLDDAGHELSLAISDLLGLETSLTAYIDGLILDLNDQIQSADNAQDAQIEGLQGQIITLEELLGDVSNFSSALSSDVAQVDSLYQELSLYNDGNRDLVLQQIARIEASLDQRVDLLSENVRTSLNSLPQHVETQIAQTLTALNLEGSVIEVVLEQFTLETQLLIINDCEDMFETLTDAQKAEFDRLASFVSPEGLQTSGFTDPSRVRWSSSKDLNCDSDINQYDHIIHYLISTGFGEDDS